jgi:hypothetical protein
MNQQGDPGMAVTFDHKPHPRIAEHKQGKPPMTADELIHWTSWSGSPDLSAEGRATRARSANA